MNSSIHDRSDYHVLIDGAGAAAPGVNPIGRPQRPLSRRGRKVAGPTSNPVKSKQGMSGANSEDHSLADIQHEHVLNDPPSVVAQSKAASAGTSSTSDGHPDIDTHFLGAIAGNGQRKRETLSGSAVATIQELWRRRQAWHRAEKSLTLQMLAICRRYVDGSKERAAELFAEIEEGHCHSEAPALACLPLLAARSSLVPQRMAIEKELSKLAKTLPVAPWVEQVRGFGLLSLAALVGECGDIGSYKSVSAVWKRMGLAVIEGQRQRRVAGVDALAHGYSPARRSVAWNIGVSLMRSQKTGQPYRDFYDAEKAKQLAKRLTAGHAHNRACRHMTKRLLAELYGAWRQSAALSSSKPMTKARHS